MPAARNDGGALGSVFVQLRRRTDTPPSMPPSESPGEPQIELAVRQADASPDSLKHSDRSVLLPNTVTRSDGFAHSIGATLQRQLPQDRSVLGFSKQVDDARPLLPSNGTLPSGEEDGMGTIPSREGASVRSAVFNLSTTIIGAGIMALPAAMRVLGVLPGVVIILIMGLLSEVSLEMVVKYTSQMKARSYSAMVGGALGKMGQLASQIAIIVNNGGILIVYMIIMGDVLSGSKNHMGIFEEWAGSKGWWTNRSVVLLLTMVFVLAPLASLKRIKSLEISSAVSVGLALLFVLLSVGIALVKLFQGKLADHRLLPSFDSKKAILELLTVIPIMTNAFGCQFNVPPIYSELRDRTANTMDRVGRISIGLCVAVYTATALSGYLLFGELTDSDVMANFDTDLGIAHSQFWNDVIRIGYVVHLFFVFPVIHFSFRETVDSLFFPKAPLLAESRLRFGLLTLVLLTVIYAGSTLIPNIWVAFEFTGATTGLFLGFMFPALVALTAKEENRMEKKLAWGILFMAVVVSVVGITTQIYSFATGES